MEDYKNIINYVIYNIGINLIDGKEVNVNYVKDELSIYLYLIILVINNDKYSQRFNNLNNCSEELRRIVFLKNDSNYIVGVHNKRIIKTIRNAFVHGSGKIMLENDNLTISNDTKPNNINENNNTTIKINKNDLLNLLAKVSMCMDVEDNSIISTCLSTINEIQNNNVLNSKKMGYIILLTLMFSYNKESLYDKYMNFMDSSLDLSKLRISDTRLLDDESSKNIKSYYEDNTMVFKSIDDNISYLKDLLKMAENGYFIEKVENESKVIWDPKLMSIDEETGIHIPNNIVMSHLRNAISHGLMEFKGDGIVFNDYNKKDGNYFSIHISFEQMNNIFISNYFKEGIKTLIETHKNMNDSMYRTQISLSKRSISDYIMYYKSKFPKKNETELINYMIDNNKISTYLYENPNCIRDFMTYVLPENSCTLLDYISNYYGTNTEDMLLNSPNIWARDVEKGIYCYVDYLKGNNLTYLLSKMLYFKNRYSYASKEEIEKSISKEEIIELNNNIRLASLYSFTNHNYFEQLILGNYLNNTNEIERIMCAIVHYDKYVLSNWDYDLNLEVDDVDNVYDNSTEYKTTLETYELLNNNENKLVRTIRKIKFKMKMLDFFKNKISENKMSSLNNLFDKVFLKTEFDKMIMLYVATKLKEGINERRNKKNGI